MRCRITYNVDSELNLENSLSIKLGERTYELQKSEGDKLAHIGVEIPVPDTEDWPSFDGTKKELYPGGKSFLPKLRGEMQLLESLLSLFGVRKIGIQTPDLKWIPENSKETGNLEVYSFSISERRPDTPPLNNRDFGLLVQFILASQKAENIEVPLSFYRKGVVAFSERRNFEAIINWYFMLETLFGDGRWRKAGIVRAFRKSESLTEAIEKSLKDPSILVMVDPPIRQQFDKSFRGLTVSKYIDYLVDLRGFLHHHSQKHPRAWDPDNPNAFELDAVVLQSIATKIAIEIVWPYASSPEVEKEFKEAKTSIINKESEHP